MDSDIEIARSIQPRPIGQIADQLGGVAREHLLPFGREMAKIDSGVLETKGQKKVAT